MSPRSNDKKIYVVPLILEPVKRLLSAVSTILGRIGLDKILVVVRTTSPGNLGLRQRDSGGCTSNLTLISIHIHLLRSRIGAMNPEPGACAATFRACRHVLRDFELGEAFPDRSVINRENDEIFGLDL